MTVTELDRLGCTVLRVPQNPPVHAPTRADVFAEAAQRFRCKRCGDLFGSIDQDKPMRDQRCQFCGATIDGKVYPQRRSSPREVKQYEAEPNQPIDDVLRQLIADHESVIADYARNPNAVNSLVGPAKKLLPHVTPGEIRARLSRLIEERP